MLLLNTPGKKVPQEENPLKNLSELEDTPKTSDGKVLLPYIKNISSYNWDLAVIFLGFARDVEASDQLLADDLDKFWIRNEAMHGNIGQDYNTEQDNGNM